MCSYKQQKNVCSPASAWYFVRRGFPIFNLFGFDLFFFEEDEVERERRERRERREKNLTEEEVVIFSLSLIII